MTETKAASIPVTLYKLSLVLQVFCPTANYRYLYALQTRHGLFNSVGSKLYDIEESTAVFERYIDYRLQGYTVSKAVEKAKG